MVIATTVVGILAVLLSPGFPVGNALWQPDPIFQDLTGLTLVVGLASGILTAFTLGFGVAFLAFGWPVVRRLIPDSTGWAAGTYLSFAVLLISPWFHDNLHVHFGVNVDANIIIGFFFHWSLVVFVAILLFVVFRLSAANIRPSP